MIRHTWCIRYSRGLLPGRNIRYARLLLVKGMNARVAAGMSARVDYIYVDMYIYGV